MSSLMVKRHRAEADHDSDVAKYVLRQFMIDNAPKLKYVEACEFYDSAARQYCIAELRHKAVECYLQSADMCVRQISVREQAAKKNIFALGTIPDGELESLVFALRAAELEEEYDPPKACEAYRDAIRTCCDAGLYSLAGNLQEKIIFLTDYGPAGGQPPAEAARDAKKHKKPSRGQRGLAAQDYKRKMEAYRVAADLYGAAVSRSYDERKRAPQHRCLLKAALMDALHPTEPHYDRAAETIEAIAMENMKDNMTAPNAVRLFFKVALCFLVAQDHEIMRGKLEIFSSRHVDFALSPERLFLLDIEKCIVAAETAEPGHNTGPYHDDFMDRCYNLAQVRKLDAWELRMLQIFNDRMVVVIDAHDEVLAARRADQEAAKIHKKEERERQARIRRDAEKADAQKKRVR